MGLNSSSDASVSWNLLGITRVACGPPEGHFLSLSEASFSVQSALSISFPNVCVNNQKVWPPEIDCRLGSCDDYHSFFLPLLLLQVLVISTGCLLL